MGRKNLKPVMHASRSGLIMRVLKFYPNNTSAVNNSNNEGDLADEATVTRKDVGNFEIDLGRTYSNLLHVSAHYNLATPADYTISTDTNAVTTTGKFEITVTVGGGSAGDIAANAANWISLLIVVPESDLE